MNLREGLRRLYVTGSVLILLLVGAVAAEKWPTQATVESETAWALMKHAETLPWNQAAGKDAFQLRHRDMAGFSNGVLIKILCDASPTTGAPSPEQELICLRGRASLEDLWKLRLQHAAKMALWIAIAAGTLFGLWVLLSWITKGFAGTQPQS